MFRNIILLSISILIIYPYMFFMRGALIFSKWVEPATGFQLWLEQVVHPTVFLTLCALPVVMLSKGAKNTFINVLIVIGGAPLPVIIPAIWDGDLGENVWEKAIFNYFWIISMYLLFPVVVAVLAKCYLRMLQKSDNNSSFVSRGGRQ